MALLDGCHAFLRTRSVALPLTFAVASTFSYTSALPVRLRWPRRWWQLGARIAALLKVVFYVRPCQRPNNYQRTRHFAETSRMDNCSRHCLPVGGNWPGSDAIGTSNRGAERVPNRARSGSTFRFVCGNC